jgi:CDP-4-dehydro-6-deoxyglucose reductase
MAQWISLGRAAQLLGVPRGVLQQRVRAGELALSDGLIRTDALLRLYPQARPEDDRLREQALPGREVLARRLFRQSQDLADAQRHQQRNHALVIALRDELRRLDDEAGGADARLRALRHRLGEGLARVLATEAVDALDAMDDMLEVVSAQVTLRPSGHRFLVEGHDTLLQAGMRAGLQLNYGCGDGSCGMCKLRVTAGEVARTQHTDYALSEAEKGQGYVLACAHTAASAELTLEALEAGGPDDIPPQQLVAQVRALRPLAPDTLLLHLQTPPSRRLRFLAGQSLTLALPPRGQDKGEVEEAQALHPIASCPCDDRNLHFYIPRDAGDAVAARLFAGEIAVGDSITLWGPSGRFTLAEEDARPLVFAACDTAFAPVKSLIEHALSLDDSTSISLFWLATRADGHFQANQCRAWSQALDSFECTLSSHDDAAIGAAQMAAAMRADLFDIDCAYYLAGPRAFVDTLVQALAAAGVPAAQRHTQITP